MRTKIILFANQNNGYNITHYLHNRKDAQIVKIIVYEDSPKQWWKSVKKLAQKYKLKYIVFKSNEQVYEKIKDLDVDLIISANWRHKIPPEILKLPKNGAVNFHNSLLPKYRGAYANAWPILQGKRKSGVSLHWMTEKFDDGEIIYQMSFNIFPWETAREVWHKVNREFLKMFKLAWDNVDQWRSISQPQKGKPSYYSIKKFQKNNEIKLTKRERLDTFINFLRAKSFHPHYKNAYFIDPVTKEKVYITIHLHREKK